MGDRGSFKGYYFEPAEDKMNKAERRILQRLIDSKRLKGFFVIEFRLISGERIDALCIENPSEGYADCVPGPTEFSATAKKFTLDAIARGKEGDTIWIIEVKDEGDLKHALGQVLVYGHVFSKEHPKYNVKKAILCNKEKNYRNMEVIRDICKEQDIVLFVI